MSFDAFRQTALWMRLFEYESMLGSDQCVYVSAEVVEAFTSANRLDRKSGPNEIASMISMRYRESDLSMTVNYKNNGEPIYKLCRRV